MAVKSPDWLNACYVQKVLRNADEDESIEVHDITVKGATAPGDGYASDMRRVTVKFSRVQDGKKFQDATSLVVKVAIEGELRGEMIEAGGFFVVELSMMSITLPKMAKFLENVTTTSLSARCLHVQYEKPTHLVLEDLTLKGFRLANRQAGLDLDHCFLTVRNLGRFHAASIAIIETDPNAFTKYKKGLLHKDQHPDLINYFKNTVKSCAEEIATWSELSPRIREKITKLSECAYEKGCEAALYREDDFNVLNHGDAWVNNMMFRYDEQQKPIEHIFVDFQVANYGSPAIDLLYFLSASTTNEIRLHQRELLLREYHTTLTDTMVKLKCKTEIPTFEKLHEILKNRAFCEVFYFLTVLPGVVLEEGEKLDFNEMLKADGKWVNPMYSGKTYRKYMNLLLPLYDSKGLLDL